VNVGGLLELYWRVRELMQVAMDCRISGWRGCTRDWLVSVFYTWQWQTAKMFDCMLIALLLMGIVITVCSVRSLHCCWWVLLSLSIILDIWNTVLWWSIIHLEQAAPKPVLQPSGDSAVNMWLAMFSPHSTVTD